MAEYIYTREIVLGRYNISSSLEKSSIINEIRIALPGKTLNSVNMLGSDVKIQITPTLNAGEKTTLDTVVQDHKDNSNTNIIYPYKLTNNYEIDTEKNINYFGLHRKDTIDSLGLLVTKEYYKNYDGTTYSDLVIKDEYVYTLNVNDLVDFRTETITWYLTDDSVGTTKVFDKYYNLTKGIKEGMVRRTNLIDKAKAYGMGTITGTHASGLPNSYVWFSTMNIVVVDYINGTLKQDIIDFIDNETETYITQTIKDIMTDILDYWTV